ELLAGCELDRQPVVDLSVRYDYVDRRITAQRPRSLCRHRRWAGPGDAGRWGDVGERDGEDSGVAGVHDGELSTRLALRGGARVRDVRRALQPGQHHVRVREQRVRAELARDHERVAADDARGAYRRA